MELLAPALLSSEDYNYAIKVTTSKWRCLVVSPNLLGNPMVFPMAEAAARGNGFGLVLKLSITWFSIEQRPVDSLLTNREFY